MRTTDGRVLGPRGMQTRRAILDALYAEVHAVAWQNLKISEMMTRTGKSPAVFYLHFHTPLEALAELCDLLKEEERPLTTRLAEITHLCNGQIADRRRRRLPDPIADRLAAMRTRIDELEKTLAGAVAPASALAA